MKTLQVIAVSLAFPGAAAAQSSDWEFSATAYGWLPGISTSIDTDRGRVAPESDFDDVLSKLDFAFMGAIEARIDRVGVIGDLLFASLSSSEDTPLGALYSEAESKVRITAFSGYAAYRIYETPRVALDLAAGFRAYDLDLDLSLEGALLRDRDLDANAGWVDPLVAARIVVPFSDRWSGTGFVDVGGFGLSPDTSDLTWQALAVIGYQINETWSVRFGYRYLSIEKPIEDRDTELDLYGPLIGVTARF